MTETVPATGGISLFAVFQLLFPCHLGPACVICLLISPFETCLRLTASGLMAVSMVRDRGEIHGLPLSSSRLSRIKRGLGFLVPE